MTTSLLAAENTPAKIAIIAGNTSVPDVFSKTTGQGTYDLYLRVKDIQGSYTIPYIQSSRELRMKAPFPGRDVSRVEAVLSCPGHKPRVALAIASGPLDFGVLSPGEYTVQLRGLDRTGQVVARATYHRLGIGVVMAAIGDSITEGYFSRGYLHNSLELTGDAFPSVSVSRDRRNFPQYSPTTKTHLPAVNCFESWTTRLNDLASERWKSPVFIANEGWGGITSAGYLKMMQTDTGWQQRMKLLQPKVWLVHLGVNDERAKVPAATVAENIEAIARILMKDYGAKSDHIVIASPAYDYFEGAEAILKEYCRAIEQTVSRLKLSPGPDFFTAYSTDKGKWYGADPVHPNIAGMGYMAELWSRSLSRIAPFEAAS
ncbi:MAG: SGNH/GDSL hydrolase family protein [Candidatus Hydrogenedentes bacterium]|nr:SGNH/GDSL hydrolase family protein [Candidatus Hydrogenedentota bacterium]